MKKVVSSSNLALRFYKCSGWTKKCLEKYLIEGFIDDTQKLQGDKREWAYYRLGVGSRLDMDRLYKEQVSTVNRMFDDRPGETDLEFMKRYNW